MRKLTPRELFHTLVQLVGGANEEGYSHALMKVFSRGRASRMPAKSSLCRMRQKISWKFFRDLLQDLLNQTDPLRKTWKGLYVYAIDGQMWTLPRTKELLKEGFSGRAVSRYRESHYLKGFFTHAVDVLSGISKDFAFGPRLHEQADAYVMVKNFEKNSLTLYDRLYFSKKLVRLHLGLGNFFLFRLRRSAGKEIEQFFHSKKQVSTIEVDGKRIRLLKSKSKKGEIAVFATNLPPNLIRDYEIWKLYRLRWEVETSFRELTSITKSEQWHSHFYNGILQEIYCRLFLSNYTKAQMQRCYPIEQNPLTERYRKANYKLLRNWILINFPRILRRNPKVWENFRVMTKRSIEKREREKRSYPREVKRPATPYKQRSCRWVSFA